MCFIVKMAKKLGDDRIPFEVSPYPESRMNMKRMTIEKVLKSISKIKSQKTKDAVYKLASYCSELESRMAVAEDQACQLAFALDLIKETFTKEMDAIKALPTCENESSEPVSGLVVDGLGTIEHRKQK